MAGMSIDQAEPAAVCSCIIADSTANEGGRHRLVTGLRSSASFMEAAWESLGSNATCRRPGFETSWQRSARSLRGAPDHCPQPNGGPQMSNAIRRNTCAALAGAGVLLTAAAALQPVEAQQRQSLRWATSDVGRTATRSRA